MGARENLMAKLNVDNEQLNEIIKAKMAEKKCSATQALILMSKEAEGKPSPAPQMTLHPEEKIVPRGVDYDEPKPAPKTTASEDGFTKAVKDVTKHRIAITGPAGSGKTWTSLLLATNFGGKVALADTEFHSAANYAHKFNFDTMLIEPPYTVKKYNRAIDIAVKGGYSTLILDSISHMWDGEGGLLEESAAVSSRPGYNKFSAWSVISPEYKKFLAHMMSAPIHMIHTIRSKTDWLIDKNPDGSMKIQKVGLAPTQRKGIEYEYTFVFDMDVQHRAVVSKQRAEEIEGFSPIVPMTMDEKIAKKLMDWLEGNK